MALRAYEECEQKAGFCNQLRAPVGTHRNDGSSADSGGCGCVHSNSSRVNITRSYLGLGVGSGSGSGLGLGWD